MKLFSLVTFLTFACCGIAFSEDVLDSSAISGNVEVVIGPDGKLNYFFIPDAGNLKKALESEGISSGALAGNIDSKIIGWGVDTNELYKVVGDDGAALAYYNADYADFVGGKIFDILQPGQSIQKVEISETGLSAIKIPISREDFTKNVRGQLLSLAKETACQLEVVPASITVSASLSAGVSFVASGQGTVEISATWDTSTICP